MSEALSFWAAIALLCLAWAALYVVADRNYIIDWYERKRLAQWAEEERIRKELRRTPPKPM